MLQEVTKFISSRSALESAATEGDSPVGERNGSSGRYLSTAGHVEPRGNLGGPSSKATYYLVTDSELVP